MEEDAIVNLTPVCLALTLPTLPSPPTYSSASTKHKNEAKEIEDTKHLEKNQVCRQISRRTQKKIHQVPDQFALHQKGRNGRHNTLAR